MDDIKSIVLGEDGYDIYFELTMYSDDREDDLWLMINTPSICHEIRLHDTYANRMLQKTVIRLIIKEEFHYPSIIVRLRECNVLYVES